MEEVSANESAWCVIFSRCDACLAVAQLLSFLTSDSCWVSAAVPQWADGSDDKQMHLRLGRFGLHPPANSVTLQGCLRRRYLPMLGRTVAPGLGAGASPGLLSSRQMLPLPRKHTPRCGEYCAYHEICVPSPKCCAAPVAQIEPPGHAIDNI